MIDPHGGKLISKYLPAELTQQSIAEVDLRLDIDIETAKDAINICNGLFSPLEGFVGKEDFENIVYNKKLASGLVWTIPIFFSIEKSQAAKLGVGSSILINNDELEMKAILTVSEIYEMDSDKVVENVFGTNSDEHPGVESFHERLKNKKVVAGDLFLVSYEKPLLPEFNFTPSQTRAKFEEFGWKTIVGFQTRNPAHIAHEFIQKVALEFVDGLFISPIMGKKKAGDFKDEVILAVYKRLTSEFYPKKSTLLGVFPARMNYAGPRDAVFHAIVRKNYGCTHFIVGRDHAGVNGFYDKFAAHNIFDEIGDIGIQILKFSDAFYSHKSLMYTTAKVSPFDDPDDRIAPSGTEVRRLFQEKKLEEIEKFMRKEAVEEILKFNDPFVS